MGRRGPWGTFVCLWAVFFFQGATPGFWFPALTNILRAQGLGEWVALAFAIAPLCALVSPLIGGALADQRIPADRLFAWCSLSGAGALAAAFWTLDAGWHPNWFLGLLALYSIISGPTWGLIATLSMTHLSHPERQFPLVRMGATLGWMGAGLMTSLWLRADTSPLAGHAGAVARVAAGLVAFLLPHTPPLGKGTSWRDLLGLQAFSLFRQRDHAVFFLVTALFSIPLTAFYMYAPEQLRALGDQRPTATMTIAQWSEIAALLGIGYVMSRFRIKTVLLAALGLSAIRFGMSAFADVTDTITWHIAGIALHGVCFTFYFITAQVFLDRRVDPGLRGQAQGLLGMVSGGLGPLAGAFVCAWLRDLMVTEDGEGWALYWNTLSGMIVLCFVIFAFFYRGRGRSPEVDE